MENRKIIETMRTIDLHTHTNLSGGTSTPTGIVQEAEKKGLSAIAITDHYDMSGVKAAIEEGNRLNIEVIPGVEIPTKFDLSNGENPRSIHLLGLFVDSINNVVSNTKLDNVLKEQRDAQIKQDRERIGILSKKYNVDYDEAVSFLQRPFPGAYHLAKYLRGKGIVDTEKEGRALFNKGGIAYVKPCIKEPYVEFYIYLIHQAGGLAVLAHPIVYWLEFMELENMIKTMKGFGLDGIETRHSDNTSCTSKCMRKLAKKYDLCESGGSDFHGKNSPEIELGTGKKGNLHVPYSILEDLRKYKSERSRK